MVFKKAEVVDEYLIKTFCRPLIIESRKVYEVKDGYIFYIEAGQLFKTQYKWGSVKRLIKNNYKLFCFLK